MKIFGGPEDGREAPPWWETRAPESGDVVKAIKDLGPQMTAADDDIIEPIVGFYRRVGYLGFYWCGWGAEHKPPRWFSVRFLDPLDAESVKWHLGVAVEAEGYFARESEVRERHDDVTGGTYYDVIGYVQ